MISAKKISIEGLCRNMGIDPKGAVDFVNLILSDCQPVKKTEDLTEEAYQSFLSRVREMKREQEKDKDKNKVKVVLSGNPTAAEMKKLSDENQSVMDDYIARRYAGMTPEQIEAKKQKALDYMYEAAETAPNTGLYRKPRE